MEVRQLKYFLTLCEKMNYTSAAKELFLTRQALKQSIAALERELGEPLFKNEHNHLSLTERGSWLQYHARPAVESFMRLEQEICAAARPSRPLRIGVSVALVPDYLPDLPHGLERFKIRYPNLAAEVSFLPNDAVLSGVEDGRFEFGLIMDLETAVYRMPKTVLRRDTLLLMVSKSHRLSGNPTVSVSQLQGEQLLLPGLRAEPFQSLLDACAAAGFALQSREADSFFEVNYFVRNHNCIGVTRAAGAHRSQFDLTYDIPLRGAPPLCVSLLQGPSASGAFAALLRGELKESTGNPGGAEENHSSGSKV